MTKPTENQSTYSCMILYTFFFICCPEVIRMYAFCQLGNREPFGRGGIEFSQAWQTCLCFLYTPTLKFYRKIESLWLAHTTQQKPNSSHRNHPGCLKLVQVRSFDMQISMCLGQSNYFLDSEMATRMVCGATASWLRAGGGSWPISNAGKEHHEPSKPDEVTRQGNYMLYGASSPMCVWESICADLCNSKAVSRNREYGVRNCQQAKLR